MLVIPPKYSVHGEGLADIISKIANSGIARKVVNSSITKKVLNQATKKNLQKAANSALGKQLKSAVVSGVANASEKVADSAFKKLGISDTVLSPKTVHSTVTSATDSAFQKLGIATPEPKKPESKKRKRKLKTTSKPSHTKRKRTKGFGIVLEK